MLFVALIVISFYAGYFPLILKLPKSVWVILGIAFLSIVCGVAVYFFLSKFLLFLDYLNTSASDYQEERSARLEIMKASPNMERVHDHCTSWDARQHHGCTGEHPEEYYPPDSAGIVLGILFVHTLTLLARNLHYQAFNERILFSQCISPHIEERKSREENVTFLRNKVNQESSKDLIMKEFSSARKLCGEGTWSLHLVICIPWCEVWSASWSSCRKKI